ncbi:hypothetical protein [Candidatus Methylomicrobium oryzae]|jgi:hypothetical protein|uniref:hypothetical protein n=1 Tax=Candidatus Methylomicrobium oryzae TaxID=2802053 RepID=UPI001922CDF2|nr:hypothetical protein [Methylomicrobium sp. RS1]MBL1265764.1 hypothetical protein [Methylomicrobium sp. RS1]
MIHPRSICFTGILMFTGLPFQAAAAPTPHIHVIVSLVDNVSQGIVPVPAKIGNGNDIHHNLYWGAAYGVKTFLSRAPGWRQLGCENGVSDTILERCRFAWEDRLTVTAEAYRGSRIDRAMLDFMQVAATPPDPAQREMVVFIGHDGLMDEASRPIVEHFPKHAQHDKQAVVLACLSDEYFAEHLQAAGSQPVVTTFSFMAPEAYVLEAVARGFADQADEAELRGAAASAYAKYQHISAKAGNSVFGAASPSRAIKLSRR